MSESILLHMFRDDFEFSADAAPSHLLGPVQHAEKPAIRSPRTSSAQWGADAEAEVKKIPFFVRGKARRNTERFAEANGVAVITVDTLYEAKAHYGR